MSKQGVTDEEMAWLHYVIGWTAPEIRGMLRSGSELMRAAGLGLLGMAGITEEDLLEDLARRDNASV